MGIKIIPDESYLGGLDPLDTEKDLISVDERRELENQLKRMIGLPHRRHREPTPQRDDRLFPRVVVIGAVLIVGLVTAGTAIGLDRRISRLSLDPQEMSSGEGRVLEKYREESEIRIRQKDTEILDILGQMDRLERQRRSLELITRVGIEQRETQLRQKLADELARERAKLRAEGVAFQDADIRIRELQDRLNARSEEELLQLRSEADVVLAVQARELTERQNLARTALIQASRERTAIVTHLEIAMSEGVPPEHGEPDPGDFAEEKTGSDITQERQLAVSAAIADGYTRALQSVAQSRLDLAGSQLKELRALLSDPSHSDLPAIVARRGADRRIVDNLELYVAQMVREREAAEKTVAVAQPDLPSKPVAEPESVPAPLAPFSDRAVGRVALADGESIVVETLTGFAVPVGATLELWRTGTTNSPLWVAYARVIFVADERVIVSVTGRPAVEPRVLDLAYLVPE